MKIYLYSVLQIIFENYFVSETLFCEKRMRAVAVRKIAQNSKKSKMVSKRQANQF